MGTIARSAAPSTTAAKSASKLGRGTTSIPSPRASRAASWLNAPRSPWIATLSFGPLIAGMLPSWQRNSKQRTARGGGFTPIPGELRRSARGVHGGCDAAPPVQNERIRPRCGAEGGIRTPTPFRAHGPKPCASAVPPLPRGRGPAPASVYPVLSLQVASTPWRPPLEGRVHRGDVGPQGARLRDRGRGRGQGDRGPHPGLREEAQAPRLPPRQGPARGGEEALPRPAPGRRGGDHRQQGGVRGAGGAWPAPAGHAPGG